jgi:hypothetical protein
MPNSAAMSRKYVSKSCVQAVRELRLLGGNTVMLSPTPSASAQAMYALAGSKQQFTRFIPGFKAQAYAQPFTSVISGLSPKSTGPITTITMYIKSKRATENMMKITSMRSV